MFYNEAKDYQSNLQMHFSLHVFRITFSDSLCFGGFCHYYNELQVS